MKKSQKIKRWAVTYKNYLVGTYKSKKEAETAIRPDPEHYKIMPCEIVLKPKL